MSKTSGLQSYYLPSEKAALDPNVEASHTIIECVHDASGLYSVDALTAQGWLRMLAVTFDPDERDTLIRRIASQQQPWENPRATVFIGLSPIGITDSSRVASGVVSPHPDHAESNIGWTSLPEQILDRLECEATTEDDRITAVLFAEIAPFEPAQKLRLLHALFEFIEQHRFSKDDEIMTAVGSAIRKFAMNMPTSEFESYSRLFLPTATDTLSCEIELELAKAVGWRLAKVECAKAGEHPNLEARLSELASDYLTARLILQENYASIVVNAVIAVALLNGARQDELIDRIANLHIGWFRELVARRMLQVAHKRNDAESAVGDNLARLHQRLVAAGR